MGRDESGKSRDESGKSRDESAARTRAKPGQSHDTNAPMPRRDSRAEGRCPSELYSYWGSSRSWPEQCRSSSSPSCRPRSPSSCSSGLPLAGRSPSSWQIWALLGRRTGHEAHRYGMSDRGYSVHRSSNLGSFSPRSLPIISLSNQICPASSPPYENPDSRVY